MTQQKTRYPIRVAASVARWLMEELGPACERIEVAGSVRRNLQMVGDVELVCVPRYEEARDLFGQPVQGRDLLDAAIQALIQKGHLEVRTGPSGGRSYGPRNKFLLHVANGVPVDVFSTEAANFGLTLFVRTGPRDWNIRAMQRLKQLGLKGTINEGVWEGTARTMCATEEQVFTLLRWPWTAPEARR